MKKFVYIALVLTILSTGLVIIQSAGASGTRFDPSILREGDIIFHQSYSDQSEAVRIATSSKFSHMAIIFKYKGRFMIFEAVQPVKISSITEFARRGGNSFVIKRLKDRDSVLTPETIEKMKIQGKKYLGKNYDYQFRWDDKRIYCSELVWKIYKYGAGIEVGRLQYARDMNLDNPVVRRLIEKRYGKKNSIPADEIVISPQSIYECDRLVTVYEQ